MENRTEEDRVDIFLTKVLVDSDFRALSFPGINT